MNEAIELHDSTLTAVETTGASARVVLDVYLHRSEGVPGRDPGTGWIQRVVLHLEGAHVSGPVPGTLDALDGFFEVAERRLVNLIPLPIIGAGPVRLHLEGPQGALDATAAAARIERVGEARFVEVVPPLGRRT